jgi:hypothetical protein
MNESPTNIRFCLPKLPPFITNLLDAINFPTMIGPSMEILCVTVPPTIPILFGSLFPFGIIPRQNNINLPLKPFDCVDIVGIFTVLLPLKLLSFLFKDLSGLPKFPRTPPRE